MGTKLDASKPANRHHVHVDERVPQPRPRCQQLRALLPFEEGAPRVLRGAGRPEAVTQTRPLAQLGPEGRELQPRADLRRITRKPQQNRVLVALLPHSASLLL